MNKKKYRKKVLVILLTFIFSLKIISQSIQPQLKQEVYNDDFTRNTFYSWTTLEQIIEIQKTKKLLYKSKSSIKGKSIFDNSLNDSSLKNNPLVKLLQDEKFQYKRFGWTNAWATVMGWEGETYGDQLIKITLSDSAIIGKLDISNTNTPLCFYNMSGLKLTDDYIIKNKSRIAAIYHVNKLKGKRTNRKKVKGGTYKYESKKENYNIPFREFVIFNESMIKSWSVGTKEIKDELIKEIETLKEFKKSEEAIQYSYSYKNDEWDKSDLNGAYSLSQYQLQKCFDNDYYLFNSKRIEKIINKLNSISARQNTEIIK